MLHIYTLGTPHIVYEDRPLEGLRRKNRALVFYLAAHDHEVSRVQLLNLFWSDVERSSAQQTLRTMLHDLRKALGSVLVVEDGALSITTDAWVDVRHFSQTISTPTVSIAALEEAVDLYTDDFLSGFSLEDAPLFEDWRATQREHYRGLLMSGLATLSQRYEEQRQYERALSVVDRALRHDPLYEPLQRSSIRLHYLRGDRTAAIRQYDVLCKLLDEELGVPPMPETRKLYDAIITDTLIVTPSAAQTHPVPSLTPISAPLPNLRSQPLLPFTGRQLELEHLLTRTNAGRLLLIEGEAGIGKSRLIDEFLQVYPAPFLLLRGTAFELEQALPYQPIMDALRDFLTASDSATLIRGLRLPPAIAAEIARLCPELLSILPDIPANPTPADEAHLWDSMRLFIGTLASVRPVIMVIEDLHAADSSTIGLLGYLVRRVTATKCILLATTRPVDPQSTPTQLTSALKREDRLEQLSLHSLTQVDTTHIAQAIIDSGNPHQVAVLAQWLMQHAEGNPFFLTELIRYARTTHLLENGSIAETSLTQTFILPPNIQNLILARVTRLSGNARRLLNILAVIGLEVDISVATAVSELNEDEFLDTLDNLIVVGLIRTVDAGRYAFDHSLTQHIIYHDMSVSRRQALHRRIAQAYISRAVNDSFAGIISFHCFRANLPQLAATYALSAGRQAARLAAWTEALVFFEQALQAADDPVEKLTVQVEIGDAHLQRGNFIAAAETLLAAVALCNQSRDWTLIEAAHMRLVQALMLQSRFKEAIALGKSLAESGADELVLISEFIQGTALGVESVHPKEAEFHLRKAQKLLAQPRSFNSLVTPAKVTYQLAGVFGQQGMFEQAVTLYREALSQAQVDETALDLQRRILLYNNLAYYLHLLGDPDAQEAVLRGITLAREKGSPTHLSYLLSTSGEIALAAGDLDGAENAFSEALQVAERLSVPERVAGLHANLGRVAQQRGDLNTAWQRLTQALEHADRIGAGHLSTRIRIWLATIASAEEADRYLREAYVLATRAGYQGLLEEIEKVEQQLNH